MGQSPELTPDALLDLIRVGVVAQDAAARIRYCNRAAETILGRSREALVEMTSFDPHWDAVDPEGNPIAGEEHPVPRVIKAGEAILGSVMGIRLPDSEDRVWLLINALPQFDHTGAVAAVVSTFTDVSVEFSDRRELSATNRELEEAFRLRTGELSRANQELTETSSKYEAVIRAMAEGVVIHESDGAILTANPSAEAILGLTLDQMQGRHPVDPDWALSRDDGSPLPPEEIPSEITRRTQEPCSNVVLGVQRGAGERAWLSINTDPIITDGRLSGVVATFTDITAERNALSRLAESKRRLEQLTQAMPGALVESRYDSDGNMSVTFASGRVDEVMGVSAEQMLADPAGVWQQIHPEDLARLSGIRDSAEGGQAQTEHEYRIRGSDDEEWRWLRSTTGPATEVGGERIFHSIIFDVTDERRREGIRRESQRREVMGTLAAGIAHNFNNMLAAILPSLENASLKVEGELGAELGDAFRAATAASELVRQLASLARRESGAEFEEVVLDEVAEDVLQLCRRTFDPSVHLDCKIDHGSLIAMGHRSEVQQVLLNLVLNARDALAQTSKPRIEIRLSRVRSRARIEVRDNGSGMSDEIQHSLGQPFFTTKSAGKGTGLGLATAMGTIRDMSGTLTWESQLGQGSAFFIELPLAAVDSRNVVVPSPVRRDAIAAGRSILLVDDEELVRNSVSRMLGRLGASVTEVPGGVEALAAIEREVPDLLLVDLSMPGMSGAEVSARVRAMHPDLPIILMSGYLPEDAPSEVSAVLTKPFRNQTLVSLLEEVLR